MKITFNEYSKIYSMLTFALENIEEDLRSLYNEGRKAFLSDSIGMEHFIFNETIDALCNIEPNYLEFLDSFSYEGLGAYSFLGALLETYGVLDLSLHLEADNLESHYKAMIKAFEEMEELSEAFEIVQKVIVRGETI